MPIKHYLDNNLTIIKSIYYPYKSNKHSRHRYYTTIGIGGNILDVCRRFNHLFFKLKRDIRVHIVKTGSVVKNPPFGYTNQNYFYNSVMILATSMPPVVFLQYLMRVEKYFSRKRSFKNAPRTLDLDILFFDNRVINKPNLIIPHPHWKNRQSVLIPLMSLYR